MKKNDIFDYYADREAKLTVLLLDDETVLIEGTSESLTFLGKLLLAHVEEQEDTTNLGPKSAGNVFFSSRSTLGIYVHTIPCTNELQR